MALMTKWIWRLFDPNERDNLWHKLLRAKYLNADNIFVNNGQGGSQFWRSINKIKHLFKLGVEFMLGNGERVLFWTDWWQRRVPSLSDSQDFLISLAPKTSRWPKPFPFLQSLSSLDDLLGRKSWKLGSF
jgi:hypothetical protein